MMKTSNLLAGMVLGCLWILPLMVWSQGTRCPNLDFAFGTMHYWQCYSGSCANGKDTVNPCLQIPGRHTIMSGDMLPISNLYDEKCSAIERIPRGYSFSARLGNAVAEAKIDALEYTMIIDSNNSLLLVHFAWVMQKDSGSNFNEQPQFNIQIKDSAGNLVNIPCVNLNCMAHDSMQDLQCNSNGLLAHNWTTVGFNLEQFTGQTIKIYFETRDGTRENQFGYAYIVAECKPMTIDLIYCSGDETALLRAPIGFESYRWTRSGNTNWTDTVQQIALQNPANSEIITCTFKSQLGCESELKTVIAATEIDARFLFGVKDQYGHVNFSGNNYLNWYDTCSRTVTFVDFSKVYNGKKNRIVWEIHGLNVINRDFSAPCMINNLVVQVHYGGR